MTAADTSTPWMATICTAHVGCSEVGEAAEGETPIFAYAMDGYPIHSPLDAEVEAAAGPRRMQRPHHRGVWLPLSCQPRRGEWRTQLFYGRDGSSPPGRAVLVVVGSWRLT